MIQYTNDVTHENTRYNMAPNIEEIVEIVKNKKNGKSTPDFKNEMLKRPGESMLNILIPLTCDHMANMVRRKYTLYLEPGDYRKPLERKRRQRGPS